MHESTASIVLDQDSDEVLGIFAEQVEKPFWHFYIDSIDHGPLKDAEERLASLTNALELLANTARKQFKDAA